MARNSSDACGSPIFTVLASLKHCSKANRARPIPINHRVGGATANRRAALKSRINPMGHVAVDLQRVVAADGEGAARPSFRQP
jgi:hypothetical protein